MKSGSSWTWKQLKSHPQIGVPFRKGYPVKELHLIDRLNITLPEYLERFGRVKKFKTGEFTPNYMCCPYAPLFIKTHFSKAKLFTIFRNPVDRAFSHYKDNLYYRKIPKHVSFLEAFFENYPKLESNHYSVRSKGMYGDQLENWYKFFDPKEIKVLFHDDIVDNSLKFIQEVFAWVEVDPFVPPNYMKRSVKKYNVAYESMQYNPDDRLQVFNFYKDQIAKLEDLTGRKLNWS